MKCLSHPPKLKVPHFPIIYTIYSKSLTLTYTIPSLSCKHAINRGINIITETVSAVEFYRLAEFLITRFLYCLQSYLFFTNKTTFREIF